MRTTLTLEDDVALRLKAEARRTGKPMKQVVNALIRLGLAARSKPDGKAFRVRARPLGIRPGLDYDNIGMLIEHIEGPLHS